MAKILIIEDNASNMKLTRFLLTSAGHEVLQSTDAETGLALMREQAPQLVLMDIQLPGMDGLTATRQLKADPALAHIRVIAVTAHAMNGDEEKFRIAGCDDYIAKPFHHRTFLDTINRVLEKVKER